MSPEEVIWVEVQLLIIHTLDILQGTLEKILLQRVNEVIHGAPGARGVTKNVLIICQIMFI